MVLNLVAGFQALGTLMAVGIMLLPAVAARFWAEDVSGMIGVAVATAFAASVTGLLMSYYLNVPTGPAVILACGAFYFLSMLVGVKGGVLWRLCRASISKPDPRSRSCVMRNRFIALLGTVLVLLGLTCGAQAADTVKAVASFSILGDMVKQVGGDRVEVTTLVGPDGDAHVFSPTPADAKMLAGADIFFVNGLGFEGWMERLENASGFKGTLVVTSGGVKPLDHGAKKRATIMAPMRRTITTTMPRARTTTTRTMTRRW